MELVSKKFLVIGASGAIGSAVTLELQARGASVIGTTSSNESATRLPAGLEQALLLNLESQDSIDVLCNYLLAGSVKIDGLVLAAGLVAFGGFAETPIETVKHLFQVNSVAQLEVIRRLLPLIQLDGGGVIVSLSGRITELPTQGLSAYGASKAPLLHAQQAAKRELAKTGVSWIDARPGHTESGLAARAIFGQSPNFAAGLEVSAVAKRIVDAIAADEKDLPGEAFA